MTIGKIDIRHFVFLSNESGNRESGKEDLIFSQLSTINYKLSARGHSSVGRAPALQAGSQGFESPCLQIISDLANQ
jgi:hypothetical protein